ncbi:hypothetical protein E2C01_003050 [Portunus trituberculatus]|uniref:Uncharacterized protein n=1 Tax=Portunus trituberculatus TaxID=210409 RepID=A0A5B7CMM9_PORTR|nr:hypothetical protein [Portunus trituberculatus]
MPCVRAWAGAGAGGCRRGLHLPTRHRRCVGFLRVMGPRREGEVAAAPSTLLQQRRGSVVAGFGVGRPAAALERPSGAPR